MRVAKVDKNENIQKRGRQVDALRIFFSLDMLLKLVSYSLLGLGSNM